MASKLKVGGSILSLAKGDITDLEIEAFVYCAQPDLLLGSGFGTAISIRGGPEVQEELKQYAPLDATKAVVSGAGNMKAKYIVHAVVPRFQEEDLEGKMQVTIRNALKQAEAKGIRSLAFPPMGAGFYGVPLDSSARLTLETIADYLSGDTTIKTVVVALLDSREYNPFEQRLTSMSTAKGETV